MCRNLPHDGTTKAKLIEVKAHSSPRDKTSGSCHQRLFKENVRKTKRGMQILKIRVREFFMHREGISTPRIRHKGLQPLIECAQRDFKIIYFSLFTFFNFFGVDKGDALAPTYPQVG